MINWSRKIIMAVVAAVIALFGLFGVQVNLVSEIDPANIIVSLLIIGVWIFREFKQDWADLKAQIQQTNKWSDPVFWTVAITSVVLPLLTLFDMTLSETTISLLGSILALIAPLLLNVFRKTTE